MIRRATIAAALIALPLSAQAAVGILECDSFLEHYQPCIDIGPLAEQRERLSALVQQWRTEWLALAANPWRRPLLVASCTQFRQLSAEALGPLGCRL